MSKNIIIQQNGIAETLTVDALRLKTQSGGTEDWVPADGKNLVELQIGGSGTYRASDYNAYGIAVARVKPKYGGGATSKTVEHAFTEKHTPSIKEGGKSRNFSTVMLKTNLQGGGTCLWIPKMDVVLKNKYVSKSGTYSAKDDDCFGFDQVTVSGVDVEITQDEDGDDVAKITDGGTVTEEKLPSYINIEIPPTKAIYTEGDTIDFSGMVVKGYTKSGALWTDANHPDGTIPLSELTFPVTTAVHGEDIEVVDDELVSPVYLHQAVVGNTIAEYQAGEWYRYFYSGITGGPVYVICLVASNGDGESVFVSMNGFSVTTERTHPSGWDPHRGTAGGTTTTYKNYTAYTGGYSTGYNLFVEGGYTPISANQHIGLVNAAILAMNKAAAGQGRSVSVVPVDYQRPYDGRILKASFSITVMPQDSRGD